MPRYLLLALLLAAAPAHAAKPDAVTLYADHCARCHGPERLGAMGPALLPENLGRLKRDEAFATIRDGRVATQMPAFHDRLTDDDIRRLVALVYTPPVHEPVWGLEQMRASQLRYRKPGETWPDQPQFAADPLNLFVVVELGDHHFTLLDGDRFTPIGRFPTRFALHGGPKFSPDGRYVYFASRDGWISMFDIWNLKYVAEIRAGINTRNLALSSDGRVVAVGNMLPHTLVLLDAADLSPLKVIPVTGDDGRSSRVSAVYDAAPRKSFIVALKDIPEVWEIPYDPRHEPVYRGFVHDYRMAEALAEPGPFPVRRIKLDDVLDDFFFDPSYTNLIGASRDAQGRANAGVAQDARLTPADGKKGQVVNLVVGRKIAEVDLPGLPHLGSGITWDYRGTPVLATPNLKEGVVTVIDMRSWKTVKHIPTPGPGFFLRSHEDTPYAWVDASMSPQRKDTIAIIDKRSLEVVKTLTPAPGRVTRHVEFTRDGRYALVSVEERDGALVVYDAATFAEVKRLPMVKPSGKYNVYNKVTRSAGTSH